MRTIILADGAPLAVTEIRAPTPPSAGIGLLQGAALQRCSSPAAASLPLHAFALLAALPVRPKSVITGK